MPPLNRKSIRRRSFHFWGLFAILLMFTVLPAYCFIWTARERGKAQVAEWEAYWKLQRNAELIYAKINSLFNSIEAVDIDDANLHRQQGQKVNELKNEINDIMGADSNGLFMGYAHINTNISALLELKCANECGRAALIRREQERQAQQHALDIMARRQ